MMQGTNNIKYLLSKTKSLYMSLFNFFRRNKSSHEQPGLDSSIDTLVADPRNVDVALFVDEQQPDLATSLPKLENHLQVFLGQNFDWMGYNDGYSHPETEFMNDRLKLIRADFRMAADRMMENKRTELGDLQMHAIKTAGISERLGLQVIEKIKQLEVVIHELDMQKILSIENEGMIASAIYAYRLGFVRGLDKLQEEKFFAASTGLFN